jgi:hypothetical protein
MALPVAVAVRRVAAPPPPTAAAPLVVMLLLLPVCCVSVSLPGSRSRGAPRLMLLMVLLWVMLLEMLLVLCGEHLIPRCCVVSRWGSRRRHAR